MKALLRVDDKKELSNPPRVQEKELKEPEKISLWTPKDLELKETELVSVFFRLEFSLLNLFRSLINGCVQIAHVFITLSVTSINFLLLS